MLVRTLVHVRTPERLRGLAYAAYNALRNAAELGALAAGGLLVAAVGGRATPLIAGLGQVVVGSVGLAVHARRRLAGPGEPPVAAAGAPAGEPRGG